jgi:hypothetical protein
MREHTSRASGVLYADHAIEGAEGIQGQFSAGHVLDPGHVNEIFALVPTGLQFSTARAFISIFMHLPSSSRSI